MNKQNAGIVSCSVFLSAALLFLGACYTYKPVPPAIDSDSYTLSKSEEQKIVPDDCKVLTLDTACQVSEANNPNYISKYHAMRAAWSRYYQSMSSYFPTITGSYSLGRTDTAYGGMSNTQLNESQVFAQQMGGTAQWTIFDGLMREMNLMVARHNAKASEYIEEDTRRLLLKGVANQYNNVLLAIEKNRIAKTDMDFQNKLLKETKLKYDAGAVPLSDVLNFEIKVNDAENSQISAEYQYNTARYSLAALMGMKEGTIPDSIKYPPMSSSTEIHLADVEVYLDTALANRPDLKQYRESLLAAEYTLYATYGSFSPTVTLNGGYTYNINKTNNEGRNGFTYNGDQNWTSRYRSGVWNYGGTASWTLFQGGYRINKVLEAKALVAQAEYQLASKWIDVIQEVRAAHDNYIQNIKQANIYKKTLSLVTQQRDLVEEEYKAGNVELTRLNEAQRDLVQADTNLVSSLINVQNARVQLEAATNSK